MEQKWPKLAKVSTRESIGRRKAKKLIEMVCEMELGES